MKILAASDLHGDLSAAKKLAVKAKKEKVDLIILSGDILAKDSPQGVIGEFKKNNQKVLLVPGNHDSFATTDFVAEFYGVRNIHGYYAIYTDKNEEKIGFFGCGGADIGLTKITERETFNVLKKSFDKIKPLNKKVMVTHMHPAGSKAEFSGFEGNQGITKAIKEFKPDVLLCGHIHEASGIEEKIGKTKIINLGPEGKIIEI